jgi:hypothetical protein
MSKFFSPRMARVAVGLAAVSAFAVAPMAQAATTNATGTLSAGSLTNTAPAITAFSATLSGVNQTVTTDVGAWGVTDATGSNAGYSVTVAATAPTVAGSAANAGTGGSLTLTKTTATAATGNSTTDAPLTTAGTTQLLTTTAATVANAAATTGQGAWDFPAADDGLSVVIPGDASAGAYSSTLTYTTAAPVG